MSPQVIGKDGAVHGQNLQRFQGKSTPPPPYGAHISDSAIQETVEGPGDNGREYQMATGVNPGLPPREHAALAVKSWPICPDMKESFVW